MMNHYFTIAKDFVISHKKEFTIGIISVSIIAAIAILVALFMYNDQSKIVYQPPKACELFTPTEAQELLGEKVISVDTKAPVISGDTATNKCSYTDANPVQERMLVAAIAIRSGINDKGVQQNKTDFAANKPSENIEVIKDLGDSAYFDQIQGQLNILRGRDWIILSHGVGAAPGTNTIDKAVELAHKLLR